MDDVRARRRYYRLLTPKAVNERLRPRRRARLGHLSHRHGLLCGWKTWEFKCRRRPFVPGVRASRPAVVGIFLPYRPQGRGVSGSDAEARMQIAMQTDTRLNRRSGILCQKMRRAAPGCRRLLGTDERRPPPQRALGRPGPGSVRLQGPTSHRRTKTTASARSRTTRAGLVFFLIYGTQPRRVSCRGIEPSPAGPVS
jgi:hypothetical protein